MLETIADLNARHQEAARQWEKARQEAEDDRTHTINLMNEQHDERVRKLQVR